LQRAEQILKDKFQADLKSPSGKGVDESKKSSQQKVTSNKP
jgi:hypothetical protein